MKRIDEKVKDIVEVRSHASMVNFDLDPLRNLTGYHFTEITADMMAKWLNAASRVVDGGGVGLALAGFRGVGKSHFLATFRAMLAHPEYRSRVSDQHVSTATHSLQRKSYPVAMLRRGSRPSLFAELKDAIAPLVGADPSTLSDSLNDLMMLARRSSGDVPLMLLIDTDLERSSRVSRDDGPILCEIAEIAKTLGIFVGVALDDDISGADGVNSAISQTFMIDYLDQEHLYKIVDNHIFPKNNRMQPVLHDIYDYYRLTVPGFRWSEERFRSLYPLHPSIMEIAPFVRLYVHDFALLGFASEAGSRILGRPANSLIAPDEVFDNAENQLRSVEALRGAFAAFDKVSEVVVSKTPVMKRLQAKLVLKGLFLFSLDDEGATATEIGASMLIFDEYDPLAAIQYVESLMMAFADAVPDSIRVHIDSSGNRRFGFKLDGKDDLKTALKSVADKVPDHIVAKILRKQMEDRFTDCSFGNGSDSGEIDSSDCVMVWRGGPRRGKVIWATGEGRSLPDASISNFDWMAVVEPPGIVPADDRRTENISVVSWRPAQLRDDEMLALKRYHLLMTDAAIRTEFREHLAAAVQSHANVAELIFQRAYLDEGTLEIEGFEYNFTGEARAAQSQSQVFSIMLESLFEGRYPLHPYFPQMIRMKDVSGLVAELFGGAAPNLEDSQKLAATLGVPLGIVSKPNALYIPADGDNLRELPLVAMVLALAKPDSDQVHTLDSVFSRLSAVPYGLVKEASYLLLAAMVSARLIEFVTSNGDRINHRSLDLKLIWDDIVGISTPGTSGYTSERLLFWAMLLTGKSSFQSLDTAEGRSMLLESLREWQGYWAERRIAGRFDEVSDSLLNTRVWRLARTSIKAFRNVSDAVAAALDITLPVEDCLQRIADAFSDSEIEFARFNDELSLVDDFIVGAKLREKIINWLSLCEYTGDKTVDGLRVELERELHIGNREPSSLSNIDLGNLWERFKREYSAIFLARHDALLATPVLREKLDEITKTDLWWEFEKLSSIPGIDNGFRALGVQLFQQIKHYDCRYDTKSILELSPACGCSFTLGGAELVEALPQRLWANVNRGLSTFRAYLESRKSELHAELKRLEFEEVEETDREVIKELLRKLEDEKDFPRLSDDYLRVVRRAFGRLENSVEREVHNTNPSDLVDVVDELHSLVESLPT